MKYGDTLPQRSIPEWAAYNVDYNVIKRLIKTRTTDAEAQVISIPGREDKSEALKELEDELYVELFEQHQRIDLFVQSKSGEIKRRLNHLHQQTAQLKRHNPCSEHSRISIRRLERYSKLEEAILRAGEEIQSLSRFVGAQRLAFQKLIKKYKRWTGSQTLGQKVEREILGRPSSFSHQTFEPLLAAWTNALASVRAPFNPEGTWKVAGESKAGVAVLTTPTPERSGSPKSRGTGQTHKTPVKLSSGAAQLQDAVEVGIGLEFDAALATVPLGTSAGTATYWVHPDNLVELQVLLLQHMRLTPRSKSSNSSGCPTSSGQSGGTFASSHEDTHSSQSEDDVGHIVLDDIDGFTKRESGVVVSERSLQNAAASIRYCASGEAIVLVRASTGCMSPGMSMSRPFQKATIKRKHLENLFDPYVSRTFSHEPIEEVNNGASTQKWYSAQDLGSVQEWFAQHSDVRPLVDMQYRRTRLIGVGNNAEHGFWATLDRGITMKCSRQLGKSSNMSSPEICGNERTEAVRFPYAVLEIRWEEGKGGSLAQALDRSHLVERVRGFSLEIHAVAVLYKSIFTPPPFWFTMLGKDLRKVPAATVLPRRRQSVKRSFPGSASTEQTSASTNSTTYGRSSNGLSSPVVDTPSTSVADTLESSPLRPPPKKERKHRGHQLRRQVNHLSQLQHSRCWNEYDDGDEASDPKPYTILVDPRSSGGLPGAAGISRLASFITSKLPVSTQKIKQQLQPPPNATRNARRPVKSNLPTSDPETLPSPVDDDDASIQSAPSIHTTYSTFPHLDESNSQPVRNRDRLLLRLSIASFAFSFTTLFIAATLAFSAHGRAHLPADLGILVGIIAAMTSAVTGLALMCSREVSLAWLWGGMILLVFVSVCGGCWQLLVVVASV